MSTRPEGKPPEPTADEMLRQLRQIEALVAEVRERQVARSARQRSRLDELHELAQLSLDPGEERLLRDYIRAVAGQMLDAAEQPKEVTVERRKTEEGPNETSEQPGAAPADPALSAVLAGAADRELHEAEAELEVSRVELKRLGENRGTDSQALKIEKLKAAVEQERMARQHVQALRKIASDERIASLTLQVKQLEGEQQQSLATLESEKARALAAETREAALEQATIAADTALKIEKEKGKGAARVERIRGWHLVVGAFVTGGLGFLGGAAAKANLAKSAPGSASGEHAPATSAEPGALASRLRSLRAEEGDFMRIFFMQPKLPISETVGRSEAHRVFMSPSGYFLPPMPVGKIAETLGNDYRPQEDLVVMRCKASDKRILDPVLATWPNVVGLIRREYPTCSKPGAATSIRCATDPLVIDDVEANATTVLANLFVGVSKALVPETATIFDRELGIKAGFLGTGYTFSGAGGGGNIPLRSMMENSVISEYLIKNVALMGSPCHCLRVRPYVEREGELLDLDAVWERGSETCPFASTLSH